MPRLPVLAALLAGLLALAACGTPAAAGRPDVLGSWQLVSGDVAGASLPLPPGAVATLVVDEERLTGSAFCNSYSAGYRLDGDTLVVDGLGSTEMGCDPMVMAAESRFLSVLAGVDHAARDGDDLLLSGADVTLRFARRQPVPDRELVGTRWVLDTLVDGEVASSVQGEAVLRLAADGTASSTTGCTGTTGTWHRDGDVLTVVPGASTLTPCEPSVQAQDRQVSEVLTAGATVAIDGDRLALTAPDGRGLGYSAG